MPACSKYSRASGSQPQDPKTLQGQRLTGDKMLHTISHEENTNQVATGFRFTHTSVARGTGQKITYVGESLKNVRRSYIAGGRIKWCSCFEKQFCKKFDIELPYDWPILRCPGDTFKRNENIRLRKHVHTDFIAA